MTPPLARLLRRRTTTPQRGNIRVRSIAAHVRPIPGYRTVDDARRCRDSAEAAYAEIARRN
jgi:hypothetical protein